MKQNFRSVVYRCSQWTGLAALALLGGAACGIPSEALEPTTLQQALGGLDTADSVFDDASCTGAPLTRAEFIAKFAAGSSEANLGPYELFMRKRTCNTVTGCAAWGTPTRPGTGGLSPQDLGGPLSLGIDPAGKFYVRVRDSSIQEMTGYYPEFLADGTSTLSYLGGGNYRYEYVDQNYDYSGGRLIPVGPRFRCSETLYATDANTTYSTFQIAAITKSCARIVSTTTTATTKQYALLIRY